MPRGLVAMARSGGHCPLRVSGGGGGGGLYYALRGGNHVMHFRQSYWKKLVRGAIKQQILMTTGKESRFICRILSLVSLLHVIGMCIPCPLVNPNDKNKTKQITKCGGHFLLVSKEKNLSLNTGDIWT